jgi:hypothetical protein
MIPALWIAERWLQAANIQNGAVFRSFWRGSQRLRGRLQVRAIHIVVNRYPLFIDGQQIQITPGDLSRSSKTLSINDRFAAQLAATFKPAVDAVIPPVQPMERIPKKQAGDWRVW